MSIKQEILSSKKGKVEFLQGIKTQQLLYLFIATTTADAKTFFCSTIKRYCRGK